MVYLQAFLISFVLALVLSPLSIKISRRFHIFSLPNKRESNGKPCAGGIGIFLAFGIACLFISLRHSLNTSILLGLFVSSFVVALLGLVDDIRELRPLQKIIVELIAITLLVYFGLFTQISFLPIWANILVTFIWILLVVNAFNLLDIVDGLTSGLVIIISCTLLVVSLVNRDILSSVILASLIGAHLGFLRYNYPPARLYMGDTGSLFSGFILAVIAINISYAPLERPIALITPLLAMSLPIYDTFFLMIMRIKKQRPFFSKTDDHFALRLVTMGFSVRKSIWIMYLFSIFLAASSTIVAFASNIIGGIIVILVIISFIFMGKKVGMVNIND